MSNATVWLQEHADWPLVHDFFSDVAGPIGWWILLQLVVLVAGTRRGLRLAWFVGVAALTNTLLKWLWAEPRPYWISDTLAALRTTPGFGFPSGHSQGAMALWLGLWFALGNLRKPGLLLVIVVFVIGTGVSRLYYGVHSVSQVLIGFAVGFGLTVVLAWLVPKIESALMQVSLMARAGLTGLSLGLTGIACFVVYQLRADFVTPQAWQDRFEATQLRLGHGGELGEMGLAPIELLTSSTALVALLAGYAGLALLTSERGHRVARGAWSRVQCVVAALVINLAALYALQAFSVEFSSEAALWPVALWLAVQPVVALWLPLWFFGEPGDD